MTARNNKTTTIDNYIAENTEKFISSSKTFKELYDEFNAKSKLNASFSMFYNRAKEILADKGISRTRKQKETVDEKTLIDKSIEQLTKNDNNNIYDVEKYLNNYGLQEFYITTSVYTPFSVDVLFDTTKTFRINGRLYAPIICILFANKIHTNEEYNIISRRPRKGKNKRLINIIPIPEYLTYRYYICNIKVDEGVKKMREYWSLSKSIYSDKQDILQLINYDPEKDYKRTTENEESSSSDYYVEPCE